MTRTRSLGLVMLLAALMMFGGRAETAAAASLDNFTTITPYSAGKFTDGEGQWYSEAVIEAYEKGIITGMSENSFAPNGNLRISEAITLAAKIHDIYTNGQNTIESDAAVWYEPYLNYAVEQGILEEGEFADTLSSYATRAEMVHILAAALPAAELAAKTGNSVEAIPDVAEDDPYAAEILALYLAGVLTGGSDGSFAPQSNITRAETAAIVTRIINPANRQSVTISAAGTSADNTTASGSDSTTPASSSTADYVISWTDTVTEQAARAILDRREGDIRRSELDFITSLQFSYGRTVYYNDSSASILGVRQDDFVAGVADFAHFVNLEELHFYYTQGTDFSAMPALSKLSELQIYISSNVKGLSGLTRLSNLTSLNLYATEIGDFSFLSSLTNLTSLDIARTGITDLTPVSGLTRLKSLKIYGNECDAAVITNLTGLEEVTVSNEVKNKELLQFVPGYSNFNVSFNGGSGGSGL